MFFNVTKRKDKNVEEDRKKRATQEKKTNKPVVILVIASIDDNRSYDWSKIFDQSYIKDFNGDEREIKIVQAGWDCLSIHADSPSMSPSTPALVHVRQKEGNKKLITIQPDFVLIRNEVRGVTHDYRNILYGLMYAGIPSLNSLESIYAFLERPIVQSELHKIQRKFGSAKFPVISQSYYSTYRTMMYGRKFPTVLKVGHAHAGMGKMKVLNHHDWEDVRSVVAMTEGKYCTAEPYIDGEFDIRIQKIGTNNYRAFKRTDVSGNWKTNTGCSIINEIEVTDKYKFYIDEASNMFNGLSICTVDIIVERNTGKEYILEVNGTSSGLMPDKAKEDNKLIRDLVLEKMNDIFKMKAVGEKTE
mmetsp:Transcript_7749/g.8557  ORF Transcript_7749/g.8557 Transcript_7749/m.8557 type:complete len:359 (+) Transcript_7749:62-1138(+)